VNAPKVEDEGIGKTATLLNRGWNTYEQDLTLKNDLDYYHSGPAGRAVCWQDKGNRVIFKRVRMLSYQDTY
jgi:pectin methylesterase-like acyl-CoA thioesterase